MLWGQVAFTTSSSSLLDTLSPDPASSISSPGGFSFSLNPPPAPLTGLLSLLPAYGHRVDLNAIEDKYRDAVKALSDRLGEDTWMLGSSYVLSSCKISMSYTDRRAIIVVIPPLLTPCSSRTCTRCGIQRRRSCGSRSTAGRTLSRMRSASGPSYAKRLSYTANKTFHYWGAWIHSCIFESQNHKSHMKR
jgi:hypothetical protein